SLGERVLLVDDLVDTGITLDLVRAHLLQAYPAMQEIRTAVLWQKQRSMCIPDYRVEYLADNPWIHQPFEVYDTMTAEELVARTPRGSQVSDAIKGSAVPVMLDNASR